LMGFNMTQNLSEAQLLIWRATLLHNDVRKLKKKFRSCLPSSSKTMANTQIGLRTQERNARLSFLLRWWHPSVWRLRIVLLIYEVARYGKHWWLRSHSVFWRNLYVFDDLFPTLKPEMNGDFRRGDGWYEIAMASQKQFHNSQKVNSRSTGHSQIQSRDDNKKEKSINKKFNIYRVSHIKCSTGESHDENQFQDIAFF
jgi:hypothetical protein